jgi:D-xylose transport system permease protein
MMMGVHAGGYPAAAARLRTLGDPMDLGAHARWPAFSLGVGIGALQGSIIAFLNVPSFIVTLGGLLVWRGAAWFVTSGRTVAPMDSTFQPDGRRSQRLDRRDMELDRRPSSPVSPSCGPLSEFPPATPSASVSAAAGLGGGISLVASAAGWSSARLRWSTAIHGRVGSPVNYADANGITWPEGGLFISHGIAIPVLIALASWASS